MELPAPNAAIAVITETITELTDRLNKFFGTWSVTTPWKARYMRKNRGMIKPISNIDPKTIEAGICHLFNLKSGLDVDALAFVR
jgi:hypothetical protein